MEYIQKATKVMKWLIKKSLQNNNFYAFGLKRIHHKVLPNQGSKDTKETKEVKKSRVSHLSEIPSPEAKIIVSYYSVSIASSSPENM